MDTFGSFVWEPSLVKTNAITAATEAACLVSFQHSFKLVNQSCRCQQCIKLCSCPICFAEAHIITAITTSTSKAKTSSCAAGLSCLMSACVLADPVSR